MGWGSARGTGGHPGAPGHAPGVSPPTTATPLDHATLNKRMARNELLIVLRPFGEVVVEEKADRASAAAAGGLRAALQE
eukprot:4285669-Alexandrium_andersonii.AAC.1